MRTNGRDRLSERNAVSREDRHREPQIKSGLRGILFLEPRGPVEGEEGKGGDEDDVGDLDEDDGEGKRNPRINFGRVVSVRDQETKKNDRN
jgi:hypothetical protein